LLEGDLELGILTYDPADDRLVSTVLYTDHLAFIVSPSHRFASRSEVSITELGAETFVAHNIDSPYRDAVVREFSRHKVPLNREFEMPTLEAIRKMVQRNEGVAFVPRMGVEEELRQGNLREVRVKEISIERKIRLVYAAHRALSHAAEAFLNVVQAEARQ
jgi:DNA-binding transcriptional LysR family regulator